jgi:hypothetical protein
VAPNINIFKSGSPFMINVVNYSALKVKPPLV